MSAFEDLAVKLTFAIMSASSDELKRVNDSIIEGTRISSYVDGFRDGHAEGFALAQWKFRKLLAVSDWQEKKPFEAWQGRDMLAIVEGKGDEHE